MQEAMNLPMFANLAGALAVGFLIGLERGWRQRDQPSGSRVAGLRTYALVGLLGGVLVSFPAPFAVWLAAVGLAGLALLQCAAYLAATNTSNDVSVTGAVALLLTYALGALAGTGQVLLALALAVFVAVLLNLRPQLHGWLKLIDQGELTAAFQLLLLSVVVLPNLPDQNMGPYAALNPYKLWMAVVLIAGMSMAGHYAMRLAGPQRGLFFSGVLGGLASSTAATLALARQASAQPHLARIAVAGSLAACGIMFFRILILVMTLQPALLPTLAAPLSIMGLSLLVLGFWLWRRAEAEPARETAAMELSVFDLGSALGFGLFLLVMAVLVPWAKQLLGANGVFAAAALSGLLDVDAIVVTLSRMAQDGYISAQVVGIGTGIAICANMASKAGIAWVGGGSAVGKGVLAGYAVCLLLGALSFLLVA